MLAGNLASAWLLLKLIHLGMSLSTGASASSGMLLTKFLQAEPSSK